MNDQPVFPTGTPTPRRSGGIMIILVAVLAVGTIGFGIFSIYSYGQARHDKSTLNSATAAAAASARATQKTADATAAQLASESPYRSYKAPEEYGAFEIKFPKNWSATADEEQSSNTQVTVVMSPDFVRRTNQTDNLAAAKVLLVQQPLETYLKTYTGRKGVNRADITVSGIKGANITGAIGDKRTTRLVAVPVRDKTLVFINEDATYGGEFNTILAQAIIIP